MYCHWSPPDAMPDWVLTENVFGASDTRDLISMVIFTFTMRRHLIRFALAPVISSRLATFGWVRFPCATRGKHNAEFTKGGWELWSYFKPFVDQSSRNFQACKKPLVLCNALFRLSVSRSLQKIFAIKSRSHRKMEQMQTFFGPQIFWEGWLRIFYGNLLGRLTTHYLQSLVEFRLLISVCEAWQWSRMRNLRWADKNYGAI